MSVLNWSYLHFNEISTLEMYEILKLRSLVFVVEQNCVYLDVDDKDISAFHLCGKIDDKLVAYVRILPPGISYAEASIGRVLTHPDYRTNGYGIELMNLAIEKTLTTFGVDSIKIGAQCYLLKFYNNLGFKASGESYLEDGIPHREMLYTKTR